MRRREDGARSAAPSKNDPDERPSFNLVDFTPTSTSLTATTTTPSLPTRPHTIHGTRNSIFRPDALLPIIESSPRSENPTLPSTPRSMSTSLKLNDGHSPTDGSGGKSLPPTPQEAGDSGLPTPPATIHASSTSTHTRQSSVHSVAGTSGTFGEDTNGLANGLANGHSDDTHGCASPGPPETPNLPGPVSSSNARRPHSSWHPSAEAAPQYTPSDPLFTASELPMLRESPSQITLLSERDPREEETARLMSEVRRLTEAMAALEGDRRHMAQYHGHSHSHSHSMPNAMPAGLLTAPPNAPSNESPNATSSGQQLQPQNSQLQRHVPQPTVVPGFHPMQAGFMPFMAFWPPPQPQYLPCQCANQVQMMKGQLAELAAAVERLDFRPATPPHSPPRHRVRRPLPPRPVASLSQDTTPPAATPTPSRSATLEEASGSGTSSEATSSEASSSGTISRRASESSASK